MLPLAIVLTRGRAFGKADSQHGPECSSNPLRGSVHGRLPAALTKTNPWLPISDHRAPVHDPTPGVTTLALFSLQHLTGHGAQSSADEDHDSQALSQSQGRSREDHPGQTEESRLTLRPDARPEVGESPRFVVRSDYESNCCELELSRKNSL